jgi:hypothetical protein
MGGITGSSRQISYLLEKIKKQSTPSDITKLKKVIKYALGKKATDKQIAIEVENLLRRKPVSSARRWLQHTFNTALLDKHLKQVVLSGLFLGTTIGAHWYLKGLKSSFGEEAHNMSRPLDIFSMIVGGVTVFAANLIYCTPRETAQPIIPVDQPQVGPRGFVNTGTDCCLIAPMQLMLSTPYFRDILNKASSNPNQEFDLSTLLNKLVDADTNRSSFSMLALRKAIRENKGIKTDPQKEQEDPVEYIEWVLEKAKTQALETWVQRGQDPILVENNEGSILRLAMPNDCDKYNLTQLFDLFFKETHKEDPTLSARKWLGCAPDNFLVQIQRFSLKQTSTGYTLQKITHPVEMDLSLEMSKDWIHGASAPVGYEVEGFICHIGNSINWGHYIAYVKREGKWWECNDDRISEVTEESAKEKIKDSYIVSYKRVDSSLLLC